MWIITQPSLKCNFQVDPTFKIVCRVTYSLNFRCHGPLKSWLGYDLVPLEHESLWDFDGLGCKCTFFSNVNLF